MVSEATQNEITENFQFFSSKFRTAVRQWIIDVVHGQQHSPTEMEDVAVDMLVPGIVVVITACVELNPNIV